MCSFLLEVSRNNYVLFFFFKTDVNAFSKISEGNFIKRINKRIDKRIGKRIDKRINSIALLSLRVNNLETGENN